tara:strand:+ start:1047 stop:1235 length:189 start_codon:yes stop_codon:yes gene_type:complete
MEQELILLAEFLDAHNMTIVKSSKSNELTVSIYAGKQMVFYDYTFEEEIDGFKIQNKDYKAS